MMALQHVPFAPQMQCCGERVACNYPCVMFEGRSKPLEGTGVIFSRGKAPSIINIPALRRETLRIVQPALRAGWTDTDG
jgi:hypothetical protein